MPRKQKSARTGGLPTKPQPRPTQSVQAAPGKPVGERQKIVAAQKAVPLPNAQAQQQMVAKEAASAYNPVATQLGAPTEHPDEPLTAGLPTGAGPGIEALAMVPAGDDAGMVVRAMYRQFPNEDLRELIRELELEGR